VRRLRIPEKQSVRPYCFLSVVDSFLPPISQRDLGDRLGGYVTICEIVQREVPDGIQELHQLFIALAYSGTKLAAVDIKVVKQSFQVIFALRTDRGTFDIIKMRNRVSLRLSSCRALARKFTKSSDAEYRTPFPSRSHLDPALHRHLAISHSQNLYHRFCAPLH